MWRQWVRGELLAEASVMEEARKMGLHVSSAHKPWWEAAAET